MRSVYIVHGWGGSPSEPLHRWLKVELEKRGFRVSVPVMPDTDTPKIDAWLRTLREAVALTPDTILVGHSIGCQAILRFLESQPDGVRAAGTVLIAPWMELDEETIKEEGEESIAIARPWIETPIDFAKVRERAGAVTAIFSDDDPFVSMRQVDFFKEMLGAEVVIEKGRGHFTGEGGVIELPAALDAVVAI